MTGKIKLNAASGGGSVSFQAPSSTGDDRVITLPTTADGTVLTTTNPKPGNIIQVVSTTKTDSTSTNSNTYVDISGMSVTLTPSSGSKCYVTYHIVAGGATGYGYGIRLQRDSSPIGSGDLYNAQNYYASRGGFLTINGAYFHGGNLDYGYLDTHGANGSTAVTYKLRWISPYSQDIYLNRSHSGSSNTTNEPNYLASTITVMEVAG